MGVISRETDRARGRGGVRWAGVHGNVHGVAACNDQGGREVRGGDVQHDVLSGERARDRVGGGVHALRGMAPVPEPPWDLGHEHVVQAVVAEDGVAAPRAHVGAPAVCAAWPRQPWANNPTAETRPLMRTANHRHEHGCGKV